MFPYLIAGAIGYAVAKIFEEDKTPKYADGGEVVSNYEKNHIKKLLIEKFDYLPDDLYFIGRGLNGCAFITEIERELYVVKYTNSITEFWLTQMAMVSNAPNIVTIKEVKQLSNDYEYGIIHKWVDRDGMPNEAVWNIAVGLKTKAYLEKQKLVPQKEREYVKSLAKHYESEIENHFGFDVDVIQSNWGYEDGRLVLFDIDGDVKKNQYQEWMETYSKKYADGGSILLAPNGKPSNLTPEQYKLVRTPAFKKWFGDWENSPETSSKVVDENGEPLVCRHYSQKPKRFSEFTKQKPNDTRNFMSFAKEGFYFSTTDKKSIEKIYNRSKKGLLYEVFLNVKNILDLGNYNAYDFTTKKAVNWKEFTFEMLQKYVIKGRIGSFDDYTEYEQNVDAFWIDEIDEKAKDKILKLGFNGVWGDKYKYAGSISEEFFGTDQIVVFNSNQIKLADGSNTTFDSNNPDIRYAGGGIVSLKKLLDFKLHEVQIDNEYAQANLSIEQLSDGEVSIYISEIWSDIKGEGYATKLLNKLKKMSNKLNVPLSLRASISNNIQTSGGLNQQQLVEWYIKNGFRISEKDNNFETDSTAPFMVYNR